MHTLSENGLLHILDTHMQIKVISLVEFPIAFSLLSPGKQTLKEVLSAKKQYAEKNISLINLWEDQWHFKHSQIISRIWSLTGKNQRVGARKAVVARVDAGTARQFLDKFHLQGHARAKYRFGLEIDNELMALATFNIRPMRIRANYRSAELIRYCSRSGYTVVGGLSKLIQAMIKSEHPDDIMTYADKDWSDGAGYKALGFVQKNETDPLYFSLDDNQTRKLVKTIAGNEMDNPEIFTTGNYRMVLTLS